MTYFYIIGIFIFAAILIYVVWDRWLTKKGHQQATETMLSIYPIWAALGPFNSGLESSRALKAAYIVKESSSEAERINHMFIGHQTAYEEDPDHWEEARLNWLSESVDLESKVTLAKVIMYNQDPSDAGQQFNKAIAEAFGEKYLANDTKEGLELLGFLSLLHERERGTNLELDPLAVGLFYIECTEVFSEDPNGELALKWNELFESAHKEVDDDSEELVDEAQLQLAINIAESYGRAFLANDSEAGLEFLVFFKLLHERERGGDLEMEPLSLGRFYLECKSHFEEYPDGDLSIRFNELFEAAVSARDMANKEQV